MALTSKRAQAVIAKQIAKCCDDIKSDIGAVQRDLQCIKEAEDEGETERAQRWLEHAQNDTSSLEANIAILKSLDASNSLIEVASKELEKFQSKTTEVEESNRNSSKGFWIGMAILAGIALLCYIMSELGYE